MKTYILDIVSGYINPHWLNGIRGNYYDAIINDDNTITINGEKLKFRDYEIPSPGTKVQFRLTNNFQCVTYEEKQDHERQLLIRRESEKQAERNKLNRLRDEAIESNSNIQLPVKWDVGVKHVLSGLSERSWGDGTNKASVNHIMLLENLESGRLKRSKGSFLCSTNPTQDGKEYLGYKINNGVLEYERNIDGDGNKYQPKITCKACLQIVELIKSQKDKQSQKPVLRRRS